MGIESESELEGILIIDKPKDFTSFDVVAKMRGILKTRKIGHAGTLDPMATGVLPLFVGRATKCCDILPCQDKRYQAVFQLGYVTDTLDSTGTVQERFPVTVGQEQVEKALEQFRGEIWQLPPMYSAIRIDGKRLYDLARQGIEIDREKRKINIYSLSLIHSDPQTNSYTIDVSCSKGTYIRTLCADIGDALGSGATMTSLRRTEAVGYSLDEALTLEQVRKLVDQGEIRDNILSIESAFYGLNTLELSEKQTALYRNGVKIYLENLPQINWQVNGQDEKCVRVLSWEGKFLGVSYPDIELGILLFKKLFAI